MKKVKKRVLKPKAKKKISKPKTISKKKPIKRKTVTKKPAKILKVSTGVKNLDKITKGGFVKSSVNMIVGCTGTGKSIFAAQFLMAGLEKGEKCLYISFEEKKEEAYANLLEIGWDFEKYEKAGKFFFIEYTPQKVQTMLEEGGGEIETTVLGQKIDRMSIDSISAFTSLFNNQPDERESVLSLYSLLRKWTCTTLLTRENDPSIKEKHSSVLEFESDSIINLYSMMKKNTREKFLEVLKMRRTKHSTKIYPYEIKNKGIIAKSRPFSGKLRIQEAAS